MNQPLKSVVYSLSQGIRISQYLGQSAIGNLLFKRQPSPEQKKVLPAPSMVLHELKELLERDWENIQAGIYKMPHDWLSDPFEFSKNTIKVFADLFRVRDRQNRKSVREFSKDLPSGKYPNYYAQNFHFQTDGYLSENSADLYDHQVELVFGGGADAMRRQALVPLHQFAAEHDSVALLDVACGTGRFLRAVKENFPQIHITGLDLSPWYLKKARKNLAKFTGADFVEANAETLPFKDEQFDVVSCIYLFHELPRRVRALVSAELARVLKPGGLLIFEDALQLGDKPIFDASLKLFPETYHEPYFADYIAQDLSALFTPLGLRHQSTDLAFFSKILTFAK